MTLTEARQHMRIEIAKSGLKAKDWAARCGVSTAYFSRALNGDQLPSSKVLREFGLEREAISYRKVK